MEKEIIKKKAEEVLEKNNIIKPDQIDTIKIAERNNLNIGHGQFKSQIKAALLYSENGKHKKQKLNKTIIIEPDQELSTKRFMIAYLLGKFLLEPEKIIAYEIKSEEEIYRDNNYSYFARNILMPEKMFISYVERIKENKIENIYEMTKILSKKFRVPELIVLKRLEELKIITINKNEIETEQKQVQRVRINK